MKLSVSAYRAHASAHKKILDTAYQLNYGSTSASAHSHTVATGLQFQVDPASGASNIHQHGGGGGIGRLMGPDDASSDDANTPLQSPRSLNTSREEDDSSIANESDCKSPSQRKEDQQKRTNETKGGAQSWKNVKAVMAYYHSLRKIKRTKSNQRWMKLRTTVQISSAMQKKPPLKREDSFLTRFSSRHQLPETQETVEDTGSDGAGGDNNQIARRRRRRPKKQPRTVVNPDENFYFYWLLILTICVLYNLWTLIVRQSFPELQRMVSTFWLCCDSISDLIFLFDLLVQLRTGYLEQGLMVYDSKKLACHYLRSRAFLLDLAALCPLDLLQIKLGPQPLLRCPRFFKVYRAVNYYYMVESRTVWPNLWRVINLIHILLILAHWFGCFYFLLSEAEGFQGDWVYPYRPGDYATLTRKYLGSLYWSTLTLTTIGDLPTPETNVEYIFTIVSYLIGVFIFATIVGQVGNVITNRNANRLEFERLLDGAKTYMRHHKVPGGMKRRVLRWYDYSWSRGRIQGGGDINTALGLLPDKLKTELALHVNLSVLKKVTIFQECQPEFLRDLVLKMKAYIFTPGDSICRKGEVAREMFIIADGILEVLSEHGKVLTTMKAGDFFGEIGILNLDGLNKRTADVRSVGYSELFSLSREDVLAAMKDYPEAQEILQALGRKRLMEVKASARHPPHHKEHHLGLPHLTDTKGIVDKIKNEAKGLRNVLKKSRTHRRSEEFLELQPLHPSTNNKATLKRMSRVKSYDLSQEDEKKETSDIATTTTTTTTTTTSSSSSHLGASLPILKKLHMMNEKHENEEIRAKSTTPPILSPSSSVKSPPPIPEDEPIGAGLPFLQRVLMLRAREEKEKERERENEREKSKEIESISPNNTISTTTTTTTTAITTATTTSKSRGSFSRINNKMWDRLKLPINSKESPTVPSIQPKTDILCSEPSKNSNANSECVTNKSEQNIKNEPPWSKLKKAAISRDPTETPSTSTLQPQPSKESDKLISEKQEHKLQQHHHHHRHHSHHQQQQQQQKHKRTKSLVLESDMKEYKSIDDLSPEFGALPFVKRLKVLNLHQKVIKLETDIKELGGSVDMSDTTNMIMDSDLQSTTQFNLEKQQDHLTTPQICPSPQHSSTESNETPERRNLRSILKLQQQQSESPKPIKKIDSMEFRKLMRAPTIEGYAARHSKLSKSVTFNRDTLQSPPNCAAAIVGAPQNLFAVEHHQTSADNNNVIEDAREQNEFEHVQIVPNKTTNQVKLIKGSLDDEQHYFADILLAIKQVMNVHLEDMQEKFHQRFEKLEEEVKNRDEIINQLKAHICELEGNTEESFTSSFETVVGNRVETSWENTTIQHEDEDEEQIEKQQSWSPLPDQNVILDIDSATTTTDDDDDDNNTESDIGDSSEPGDYENSPHNWEIELLAQQMRQKRSASLDHDDGRPLRKRFTRGGSAGND